MYGHFSFFRVNCNYWGLAADLGFLDSSWKLALAVHPQSSALPLWPYNGPVLRARIRVLLLADTHLGFDLPLSPRVDRVRRGPDFFANTRRALEPALPRPSHHDRLGSLAERPLNGNEHGSSSVSETFWVAPLVRRPRSRVRASSPPRSRGEQAGSTVAIIAP